MGKGRTTERQWSGQRCSRTGGGSDASLSEEIIDFLRSQVKSFAGVFDGQEGLANVKVKAAVC